MMRGFVSRHRWKLGLAAVLGGADMAQRYVADAVREMEAAALKAEMERRRRATFYESNLRTCDMTVEAMLPQLRHRIGARLGLSAAEGGADRLALVRSLVVRSVAGVVASAYAAAFAVVFLRAQLNILGGHLFRGQGGTPEAQEAYLRLAAHLHTEAADALCDAMVGHAAEALGEGFDVTAAYGRGELTRLLGEVRDRFERGCVYGRFLFAADAPQSRLLDETRDVAEGPEFAAAVRACAASCIDFVVDTIAMKGGGGGRLALLGPKLKHEAELLFDPKEGVVKLELLHMRELDGFSERVYETFSAAG